MSGTSKQSNRRRSRTSNKVVSLAPVRERARARSPRPLARRGVLVGLTADGEALVDFEGNQAGVAQIAEATTDVRPEHIGREVVLFFFDADGTRPVIAGVLRRANAARAPRAISLSIDGEQLTLTAGKELVLRCGKASITMRRDGTLELRGTELLSRSSGNNRVRGGKISLN